MTYKEKAAWGQPSGNYRRDRGVIYSEPHVHYSRKSAGCQGVFTQKGRRIGKVCGDTFYKSVNASRHFLRFPPAIAFDASSLEEAEALGAVHIEVRDRETGRVYHASIRKVREEGFQFERGFGEQIGLRLEFWSNKREPEQLGFAL